MQGECSDECTANIVPMFRKWFHTHLESAKLSFALLKTTFIEDMENATICVFADTDKTHLVDKDNIAQTEVDDEKR